MTLALGLLVATVSFVLLTSAADTSAVQIRGAVRHNFRSAYDILIRPQDSYTALERREGLVRDNFLSGIFGGITMRQWRQVLSTPGVAVAAPIEMIGYILPFQPQPILINRYLTKAPVQLYRIREVRTEGAGISRYPDRTLYVYYTRKHRFVDRAGDPGQLAGRGRKPLFVCNPTNYSGPTLASPFALNTGYRMYCFAALSPGVARKEDGPPFGPGVGAVSDAYFPVLLAAVDPTQEDRLLGLSRTMVKGRMLREGEGPSLVPFSGSKTREAPVIASDTTFVNETLVATIQRLRVPPGVNAPGRLAGPAGRRFLLGLRGHTVGVERFPLQSTYHALVGQASHTPGLVTFESYRTVSPVRYRQRGAVLHPIPVRNGWSVWRSVLYGTYLQPPIENADVQFRRLTDHEADTSVVNGIENEPGLRVVGEFDPLRLPGFSPFSRVPLETYNPPMATGANRASRRALGGRPLMPNMNLGGYLAQPPLMLTTLQSARLFFNPQYFSGVSEHAPISVIRVRVVGVTGPNPVSLDRIKTVANLIHERTGLAVDITAGSSPTEMLVSLPAGRFGRPPLLLKEGWVKKGVAVVILTALDKKSLALFVLVLVVTALFLFNEALASVRSRRTEIGTLRALGWSRAHVFRLILSELALVGLAAGIVGAGLAAVLVGALHLKLSLPTTLYVIPTAAVLAVLAGLLPAYRASRGSPLDAVRPPISGHAPAQEPRTLAGMALANSRRLPGRTLVAATGLFVGVGALAVLLSVTIAFRGVVAGTLLGNFVSVQVRQVDYISVALAVVLAAASVADVLYLNVRERAPEYVTLRTSGWSGAHLGRLVAYEGAGIGVLGSVVGAGLGVVLSILVGGSPASVAVSALVAACCGVAVAVLASLLPATLVQKLSAPTVLAEE